MKKLSDIFNCWYGVNLELINCEENNAGIPFVSRTSCNNGVVAKVLPIKGVAPNPKHTLSLAGGGSVLSCFYQEEPYYSGRDLFVLSPIEEMSKDEMILYSYIISINKYRYNYGRQANKTFQDLMLPELSELAHIVSNSVKADFRFNKEPMLPSNISLDGVNWNYFNLGDEQLFTIKGSKTTPINDLELCGNGIYPYVTTQAKNNGVCGFYNMYTENGGCFTIDSAVNGYCSWHESNFSASDHVEKLIPNFKCNNYIAMFLVAIINLEQYRYNYGIKCNHSRIKNMKIKLPVKVDNTPDWEFMENYIKSLPYSANL